MGLIRAAALCQTASGETFSPTSRSYSYSCVWVGLAPAERLKDLTLYFQPVEDVSSHGVHLQLTGALPLHLIQDQRAAGEETGTGRRWQLYKTVSALSFLSLLPDNTESGPTEAVQSQTHQGRALSSHRTNVPPRVLSLTLDMQGLFQGLFQGLMLGRLLSVVWPSGTPAVSSGEIRQRRRKEELFTAHIYER